MNDAKAPWSLSPKGSLHRRPTRRPGSALPLGSRFSSVWGVNGLAASCDDENGLLEWSNGRLAREKNLARASSRARAARSRMHPALGATSRLRIAGPRPNRRFATGAGQRRCQRSQAQTRFRAVAGRQSAHRAPGGRHGPGALHRQSPGRSPRRQGRRREPGRQGQHVLVYAAARRWSSPGRMTCHDVRAAVASACQRSPRTRRYPGFDGC